MAKSKKVEKETRRLMEAVSDAIKKKGDRYKFKSKNKKLVKKIKKNCVHWIYRKGKENPLTIQDPLRPGYWKCTVCQHSFPIKPADIDEYYKVIRTTREYVDQMQFWCVKLGGDADDMRMFIRMKHDLDRFEKVIKQIVKQINKREAIENNRERSDMLAQFDAYAGFSYKN